MRIKKGDKKRVKKLKDDEDTNDEWLGGFGDVKKWGSSRVIKVTAMTTKHDVELQTKFEFKLRRVGKKGISKEVNDFVIKNQARASQARSRTLRNMAYQVVCDKNHHSELYDEDVVLDNLEIHTKLLSLLYGTYQSASTKYPEHLKKEDGGQSVYIYTEPDYRKELMRLTELLKNKTDKKFREDAENQIFDVQQNYDEFLRGKNLHIWGKLKEKFRDKVKEIGADDVRLELAFYDLSHHITDNFMTDKASETVKLIGRIFYWEKTNTKRRLESE